MKTDSRVAWSVHKCWDSLGNVRVGVRRLSFLSYFLPRLAAAELDIFLRRKRSFFGITSRTRDTQIFKRVRAATRERSFVFHDRMRKRNFFTTVETAPFLCFKQLRAPSARSLLPLYPLRGTLFHSSICARQLSMYELLIRFLSTTRSKHPRQKTICAPYPYSINAPERKSAQVVM